MALWFPIMVNADCIGRVEIQRTQTGLDGVHTYQWTVWASADRNGLRSGSIVQHREEDGAFELIRKALDDYRRFGFMHSVVVAGHQAQQKPRT